MSDEAAGLHDESVILLAEREFLRGQLSKLAEEWKDTLLCVEAQVYLRDVG